SATFSQYASDNSVIVQELPSGDISDYKYINSKYVFAPLPTPEIVQTPSQIDKIEAQTTYTAMMTDTLMTGVV
ncbi:MAG: hypothetical protein RR253_04040, partial [Oscillospiraceae bacterium]